ncbi:MAG: sugar ABC transporter permease, partial [Clostridia bacterium]|nr:sugar ABC transporter permease [Clostridia bacterium]
MNSNVKPAIKKRKRRASLDARKARAGWVFVLPFVLCFALIYLPIIVDSITFSFSKLNFLSGSYTLDFVGLKNYSDALFVDTEFVKTLTSGIQ